MLADPKAAIGAFLISDAHFSKKATLTYSYRSI